MFIYKQEVVHMIHKQFLFMLNRLYGSNEVVAYRNEKRRAICFSSGAENITIFLSVFIFI